MTATRARRVTRSFGWTTTPGRLRLAALALALAAATFGLLVATTVDRHRDAARAVAVETEPLLVAAAELQVALSDADATAVTTFVTGGQEPPERRRRYLADLADAATALTTLSRSCRPFARDRRRGPDHRPRAAGLHGADRDRAGEQPPGTSGRRRVPAASVRRDARTDPPRGRAAVCGRSAPPAPQLPRGGDEQWARDRGRRRGRAARASRAGPGLSRAAEPARLQRAAGDGQHPARRARGLGADRAGRREPCARACSTRRLEPGPGAVGRPRARLARAGRRRSRARRARRRRRQPGRLRCDAEAARRRARRVRPARRGDSTGRDTGHSTTRCSGCATASRTTDGSTTAW